MEAAAAEASDVVVNTNPPKHTTHALDRVPDVMSNLEYEPLGADEIRLINLHPGNWDDPITCQLETHRLDICPKYAALSYVWGDMTDLVPVTVNGQGHHVGTSLFTALRRLRELVFGPGSVPGPGGFASELWGDVSTLYVWADWLCLNQNDDGEKQSQVPRMGAIFGEAARVVAWLGEIDEKEEEAVELLVRLCRINPPPDDPVPWWAESYREDFLNATGERAEGLAGILFTLLVRPFFRRLWIIQEMSLADLPPIMLAGPHWCDLLSLERVRRSARTMTVFHDHRPAAFDTAHSQVEVFVRMRSLQQHHPAPSAGEPGPEPAMGFLNRYLRAVRGTFGAARSHDQLYGLLGVAAGGDDLPPALRPDYAVPFAEVYKEYARALLQDCGDISILNRTHRRLEGVPSWVPDFRACPWKMKHKPWPGLKFLPGDKMVVRGVILETCTAAWHPSEARYLADEGYDLNAQIASIRDFLLVVAECASMPLRKMVNDWMRMCLCPLTFRDRDTAPKITPLMQGLLSLSLELGHPVNLELWKTEARDLAIALEAPFVATGRGMVDRLVRLDVKPAAGDVVCVLEGSSKPVLLSPKPTEGEYEFKGMCHGWGSGGGVTSFYSPWFENKKPQSFVLV